MQFDRTPRLDPRSIVILIVVLIVAVLAFLWFHHHFVGTEQHPKVILGPPKSIK